MRRTKDRQKEEPESFYSANLGNEVASNPTHARTKPK